MHKASRAFQSIPFIAIFLLLFVIVTKILTTPGDYRNYQWVYGFYEEKEDTLDAVYIGSSGTYAYWQAALGWNSHGIAIWPYATNSQPQQATRYIIEDTNKKQLDSLYIINIMSGELTGCTEAQIH